MRGLLVIVCLLAGAVLGACPASAHDSHASAAEAGAVGAPSTLSTDRRCTTAVTAAVSSWDAQDHTDHHDADHEHDPTDHEHPPGDDVFHQMTAHGGYPDFAAHFDFTPKHALSSIALAFPLRHEIAEGIALVPPVPPPLG